MRRRNRLSCDYDAALEPRVMLQGETAEETVVPEVRTGTVNKKLARLQQRRQRSLTLEEQGETGRAKRFARNAERSQVNAARQAADEGRTFTFRSGLRVQEGPRQGLINQGEEPFQTFLVNGPEGTPG